MTEAIAGGVGRARDLTEDRSPYGKGGGGHPLGEEFQDFTVERGAGALLENCDCLFSLLGVLSTWPTGSSQVLQNSCVADNGVYYYLSQVLILLRWRRERDWVATVCWASPGENSSSRGKQLEARVQPMC